MSQTPLMMAIEKGHVNNALILCRDVREYQRDFAGRNVFHYAAKRGDSVILSGLFAAIEVASAETMVMARDYEGNTVLHTAAASNPVTILPSLLRLFLHGSNEASLIHSVNIHGETVFNLAAARDPSLIAFWRSARAYNANYMSTSVSNSSDLVSGQNMPDDGRHMMPQHPAVSNELFPVAINQIHSDGDDGMFHTFPVMDPDANQEDRQPFP
jgi:hypothetical protein